MTATIEVCASDVLRLIELEPNTNFYDICILPFERFAS